jgi:hypothetical protein
MKAILAIPCPAIAPCKKACLLGDTASDKSRRAVRMKGGCC